MEFTMRLVSVSAFPVVAMALALPATAQTYEEHMVLGDSLYEAMKPAESLEHFRAAYFASPESYEALWKFARSQIDVAKQLRNSDEREKSDSLYWVARLYADQAVRLDSLGAEGHFILSNALGRVSRSKGGKERVQYGKEIYNESARALELDPNHAGAHHILGAWHAEIRRLSGVTRFVAKTLLGGGFMDMASWDSAVVHLEQSIELEPTYIFHRLELAQVLIDIGRYGEAQEQLSQVLSLPVTDVDDPVHKETAAALLEEIRDKN
jgi:tetratricopeptide (TPR) repeat protein